MRPNILLVTSDQHRFDALSCTGNPGVRTPHLDRLAAEGALFERCYTVSPVCAPSRASIVTGLFPHQHGLWANGVTLPATNTHLGRRLADAGYRCGLVGKHHLASTFGATTEARLDDGFERYAWSGGPSHASADNGYHAWLRKAHPDVWESGQALGEGVKAIAPEAHFSRWVSQTAVEFLANQAENDAPFFLQVNFDDPHPPYAAPPEYVGRAEQRPPFAPIPPPEDWSSYPRVLQTFFEGAHGRPGAASVDIQRRAARYFAMLDLLDEEIGHILDALAQRGLAENTLVLFTSDHGEPLGDHGQMHKGPVFHEGAMRVPMIVRWPARLPGGIRHAGLVQNLDVFGTMIAASGAASPDDSRSLDLVRSALHPDEPARDWALCEYRDSGFPLDPPVHATMLVHGVHKLAVYHHGGVREGELYDLATDPEEHCNRWSDAACTPTRLELTEKVLDVYVELEDRRAPRLAPW